MAAPIALFVYNRPSHTDQTLRALAKNELAAKTDLFIFSDAPKTEEATTQVEAVRKLVHSIQGFRSVTVVKRSRNLGLAASIIDGVTRLCTEFGRAIILEDDIVVSAGFLAYMNQALDLYENVERVMHISGYMFPTDIALGLPDSFLYRATTCWGWATWKRAWIKFDPDSDRLYRRIKDNKLDFEFDVRDSMGFTAMLKQQVEGTIDSWAIRWYASVFLNRGLCLHPARSLTQNVGMDGTGVHCGRSTAYDIETLDFPPILSSTGDPPPPIEESLQALVAIVSFNRSLRGPLHRRMKSKIIRTFKTLARFSR